MLRGDYAFVSVRLQSQVSFELRVYGVLRSCYRQATPSYSKKIAHLGYALLPYRLDTYDAMASLALTSHTSTKRRSIATLRHPASTSAGSSADPKEGWLGAPADVFRNEMLERKHGGSMNPRARRSAGATCSPPQKAPTTRHHGGLSVLAKRDRYSTHQLTSPTPA